MSDETIAVDTSVNTTSAETGEPNGKSSNKLGMIPLIALIVGSSIGGGIFNATTGIARYAPAGIAILSWLIVGAGILLLVLSINNIIKKRPELDGGLVQYAEAGFGKFWGMMSGWGYWLSAWLGNVAFAALLLSAFGGLYGGFALEDLYSGATNTFSVSNIWPFMFVSLIMWGLVLLVTKGIQSAAFINAVVLATKFVPLLLVLITGFVVFKAGIFTEGFWSNLSDFDGGTYSLWDSLSGSFIGVMIWCFVGIEGACMFSDKAKKQSQVAKATNMGFILLLIVYILLSIVPYGVMSREELADLNAPALGYILQAMFGGSKAGLYIVNIGLIISLLGAWLSWTLLPVQTLELMEKQKYLPERFGKKNKNGVPVFSLIVTSLCAQAFMLIFLFPGLAPAGVTFYDFAVILCGNAVLITWLLAALYNVTMSIKSKDQKGIVLNTAIGIAAAVFQLLMMYVSGWQWIALSFIMYIPAFIMYYFVRKKNGEEKPFSGLKLLWIIAIGVLIVLAIILLATGVYEFEL